jgi:hypothetical protein
VPCLVFRRVLFGSIGRYRCGGLLAGTVFSTCGPAKAGLYVRVSWFFTPALLPGSCRPKGRRYGEGNFVRQRWQEEATQ